MAGGAREGAGRPRKEIDKREFEKLCALQCTMSEISAWFECDKKTLIAWCERTYNAEFSTVFKEKSETGKISLRRRQWQLAEKSPAMAIFLGKNLLGQTDKMEQTVNGGEALTNINVRFIKDKSEAAGNEPKSD
jgi:hypothetical protein